ncbi:DNA adenine methylase [Cronobacter sakazakii]|nr:DNA adenine methylase [Cronobacter sakazakii]ELY2717862.1 DNA adenine methylase [Cronobacter sakazakii]
MRFATPLRYPGGKGKLYNFMSKVIELNKLHNVHYAEAYAGGAGLALKLLSNGNAQKIYLNDVNRAVYSFWFGVLYQTDELCNLIKFTEVNMDEWHRQKDIMANMMSADTLPLAFSTFFLNRTNRSGILKGGVIGGKHQDGKWKLDARFNKDELISRIKLIASLKDKIEISNLDADDFLSNVVLNLPAKSLSYFDPPYYIKGKGLYENHYNHDDHVHIANRIQQEMETPWIVSYDNVEPIQKMYNSSKGMSYGINYSAQDRYKGAEVMYFSKGLKIPRCTDPVKLK